MKHGDRDRIEHGEALQHTVPDASRSPDGEHNRTPNAVDHYSLVLQIIQVVPVITAFIVHAIADDLLANLLSWLFLLVGTGSVVWIERVKRQRARNARPAKNQPSVREGTMPDVPTQPVPIVKTSTSESGITISIWVGQPVGDKAAATERRRARRVAKSRQRARLRPPDRT